jgi:hypothetical protein
VGCGAGGHELSFGTKLCVDAKAKNMPSICFLSRLPQTGKTEVSVV